MTTAFGARTIADLIAEQGERFPEHVALEQEGARFTYRELNLRANQIAGFLAQAGDQRGAVIAILLERSFEFVVAALGIMRAGAAYLPLDTHWPESRLRFALEDSGAAALVTTEKQYQRLDLALPYLDPVRDRVLLDATRSTPATLATTAPEDLAYLIYTSGSTGTPKGVEITHANLAHLVSWHQDAFMVSRHDRASHLAGLGFDAAVWELWPNLCAGATLCLPEDAVRLSAEAIHEWLLRERITIAFVPTVHAAALFPMHWSDETPLRVLLTGGDALPRFPEKELPFVVVNNYGPTECTVLSTSAVITAAQQGVPSIGRAITGAEIHILNDRGEPVAAGEIGEICIGGEGVGRGYRGRPEATSSVFVPDHFSSRPGARLYRTGDLGALRPNGEITFHGRLDRQVKIRGYRIELDEIGNSLAAHPNVRFATAIADASQGGEQELVCFVLPVSEADIPSSLELRRFLAATLPEYMLPSRFLRLQKLPLSANGKIDLKLLPAPDEALSLPRPVEDAEVLSDPLQEELLTIMRDLLRNETLTSRDNFFLAGGHSLLGMQLVLRVRKEFDVTLNIRQLFEAPTVAQLAPMIRSMRDQEDIGRLWAEVLGRKPASPDEDFFAMGGDLKQLERLQRLLADHGLSFPLERLVENATVRLQAELAQTADLNESPIPSGVLPLRPYGSRQQMFWIHYPNPDFARAFDEEQPFYSLVLTEPDLRGMSRSPSLQELASCFLQKLLALKPQEPIFLGGFCVGGVLAFEMARQLKQAGIEVALLVLLDTPHPGFFNAGQPSEISLRRAHYVLRRAAKIGPKASLFKARERLSKHLGNLGSTAKDGAGVDLVQQEVERAAIEYSAGSYDGRALLVLAGDHSPERRFDAGWREHIPEGLTVEYVDHHHTDLMSAGNVRSVADAITPHLLLTGNLSGVAQTITMQSAL